MAKTDRVRVPCARKRVRRSKTATSGREYESQAVVRPARSGRSVEMGVARRLAASALLHALLAELRRCLSGPTLECFVKRDDVREAQKKRDFAGGMHVFAQVL